MVHSNKHWRGRHDFRNYETAVIDIAALSYWRTSITHNHVKGIAIATDINRK